MSIENICYSFSEHVFQSTRYRNVCLFSLVILEECYFKKSNGGILLKKIYMKYLFDVLFIWLSFCELFLGRMVSYQSHFGSDVACCIDVQYSHMDKNNQYHVSTCLSSDHQGDMIPSKKYEGCGIYRSSCDVDAIQNTTKTGRASSHVPGRSLCVTLLWHVGIIGLAAGRLSQKLTTQ